MNRRSRWFALAFAGSLCAVALCLGCGESGPERLPVSGVVKYSDGSIPQGEVCVIRFEPATSGPNPDPRSKAASGTIQPDGSFQLTTVSPNDGVFPGEYKVTFTIKAEYTAESPSLVASQFTTADRTPHSATVARGSKNRFEFEIERAK